MSSPAPPPKPIIVGKITGTHGIKGLLKVMPYTQTPGELLDYSTWWLVRSKNSQAFTVEKGQAYGRDGLLVKLKDIDTPEAGREWVQSQVCLMRDQLPPLEHGHYWADLEGLEVSTTQGVYLGIVSHLFETGANDVIVIQGAKEHLIPYRLNDVIVSIDLNTGKMIVDWDPEL